MISVVIPVLNEAKIVISLLEYLVNNSSVSNVSEIIVVDGGSSDATVALVDDFKGNSNERNIVLVNSAKGRATQMNEGARISNGNILYFLHADSFPPPNFDEYIIKYSGQGFPAGCFKMKFSSNHPLLKVSQWFTQFNLKFCRGGDQSLFIRKELYQDLGGFNESYTIYEDCEFINRIYDRTGNRFAVMDEYITTSARKYEANGTWKLQYHFAMIHMKKTLGASPQSLHDYYKKYIVN